jgi:hypothetical protein
MATNREDIIQAARALCKATADSVALTDQQVIKGDKSGPRPTSSGGTVVKYLTVRVGAIVIDGMDERLSSYPTGGPTPIRHQRGNRRATVTIQGIGEGTDEWLESIRSRLALPAARAVIDSTGIEFQIPGGVLNLSTLLDVSIEPRFALDLDACYLLDTTEATVAATTIVVNTTLNEADGSSHIHTSDTIPIP